MTARHVILRTKATQECDLTEEASSRERVAGRGSRVPARPFRPQLASRQKLIHSTSTSLRCQPHPVRHSPATSQESNRCEFSPPSGRSGLAGFADRRDAGQEGTAQECQVLPSVTSRPCPPGGDSAPAHRPGPARRTTANGPPRRSMSAAARTLVDGGAARQDPAGPVRRCCVAATARSARRCPWILGQNRAGFGNTPFNLRYMH
jgi:hypothetical protein